MDEASAIRILKVSCFDLLNRRAENREVMLQANLFKGQTVTLVEVVTTLVLVKKSVGITAEVKVDGATTGVSNMTNNKKQGKCL